MLQRTVSILFLKEVGKLTADLKSYRELTAVAARAHSFYMKTALYIIQIRDLTASALTCRFPRLAPVACAQLSRLIYAQEYVDFKKLKRQGCSLSRKAAFEKHYRGFLQVLLKLTVKKALGSLKRTDYCPSNPPVLLY